MADSSKPRSIDTSSPIVAGLRAKVRERRELLDRAAAGEPEAVAELEREREESEREEHAGHVLSPATQRKAAELASQASKGHSLTSMIKPLLAGAELATRESPTLDLSALTRATARQAAREADQLQLLERIAEAAEADVTRAADAQAAAEFREREALELARRNYRVAVIATAVAAVSLVATVLLAVLM